MCLQAPFSTFRLSLQLGHPGFIYLLTKEPRFCCEALYIGAIELLLSCKCWCEKIFTVWPNGHADRILFTDKLWQTPWRTLKRIRWKRLYHPVLGALTGQWKVERSKIVFLWALWSKGLYLATRGVKCCGLSASCGARFQDARR